MAAQGVLNHWSKLGGKDRFVCSQGLANFPLFAALIMSDSALPSSSFSFGRALFVLGLAGGAWFFFRHFEIEGLDRLAVHPKQTFSSESSGWGSHSLTPSAAIEWSPQSSNDLVVTPVSLTSEVNESQPSVATGRYLRIGTWALGGFGPDKVPSAEAFDRVANVISGYDVLAVQQLRATQRDFVPQLAARASKGGRRFDFILGPIHEPSGEQLGFFFDTNRVVTDRTQLYTVADPDQRMTHDPLVAWFRAAGLPPEVAWTFSFVNVRIELPIARQETAELPRILNAVSRDGRGEDDCLLAGLFQADDVYVLATLAQPALRTVIKGSPTDIFARHQTSNLVYNHALTTESMGRGGVFDFLRRENLSLSEAEQVSPYLPVFAEFSMREGGER